MFALKNLAPLSASVAALALLTTATASAETLVYVTGSVIGTVDSSSPATDNTVGGHGPLSYALPAGFTAIGAEVSLGSQILYLLASNGSSCQLFSTSISGNSGFAGVSAVDASFSCTQPTGTGDLAFLNESGGGSTLDSYLVSSGEDILFVPPGGGTPTTLAITTPSGGEANIQGVADVGTYPNDSQFGVDASTQQLVQLQLKLTSGTETNLGSLAQVTFFGRTSLDYSPASQNLYLYTDGQLYSLSLSSFMASGGVATDVIAPLGAVPAGTLAMAAANGISVSNNSNGDGGGGVFTPAALLPLLSMAFLRRRRRTGSA